MRTMRSVVLLACLVPAHGLLGCSHDEPEEARPSASATHELVESSCRGVMPSYIGNAVSGMLSSYTTKHGSHGSALSLCNRIDPSWLYATPDVYSPPDVSATEAFYQEIASQITLTERQFELLNLTFMLAPEQPGGAPGRSAFEEYIAPALKALHDRLESKSTTQRPLIRLGYDTGDNGLDTDHPEVDEVMEAVRRAMVDSAGVPIPESSWNFYLIIRGIGWHHSGWDYSYEDWNHSKIALRDRQVAISGGHTFYNYWVDTDDPIYDVSMKLVGDAAVSTGNFVERLWRRGRSLSAGDCVTSGNFPSSFVCVPGVGQLWAAAILSTSLVPPPPPAPVIAAGVPVVSLARTVTSDGAGPAGEASPDLSADFAIEAALDAARSSIYISQHTMVNPAWVPLGPWPYYAEPLFDALARAIERGVLVRVLISSPWGMYPHVSTDARAVHDALHAHVTGFLEARGYTAGEIEALLCNLEVAPFKAAGPILGNDFHSHAKFIAVDERAFYVGSQNLYPSGVRHDGTYSAWQPELSEHGFLVDHDRTTDELLARFWWPAWDYAAPHVIRSSRTEGTVLRQVAASSDDAGDNPLDACSFETDENEVYFGTCGAGTSAASGFRFTGITIPRGATITDAALYFTADGPYDSFMSVRIRGERSPNAGTFTATSQPRARPRTLNFVDWEILENDGWALGDPVVSPGLVAVVQEIVNQPAWAPGNAMAMLVDDNGSTEFRRVLGRERPAPWSGHAAQLLIRYEVEDPGVCGTR